MARQWHLSFCHAENFVFFYYNLRHAYLICASESSSESSSPFTGHQGGLQNDALQNNSANHISNISEECTFCGLQLARIWAMACRWV